MDSFFEKNFIPSLLIISPPQALPGSSPLPLQLTSTPFLSLLLEKTNWQTKTSQNIK